MSALYRLAPLPDDDADDISERIRLLAEREQERKDAERKLQAFWAARERLLQAEREAKGIEPVPETKPEPRAWLPPEALIGIARLVSAAAELFDVTPEVITGGSRIALHVRARHAVMMVAREASTSEGKPRWSYPQIARQMGGRDHTSVIHGHHASRELAKRDAWYSRRVELLRKHLPPTVNKAEFRNFAQGFTWTPEQDAALIACRERGLCYLACRDELGISRRQIERRVKELGLPKLRTGKKPQI